MSDAVLLVFFNPLYTELTLPHYILEVSNFNFRYSRLWNLHIPKEKWLTYLQTVETLIRRRILRRLIWVCTVCQLPFYGSPDYKGSTATHWAKNLWKLLLNLLLKYQMIFCKTCWLLTAESENVRFKGTLQLHFNLYKPSSKRSTVTTCTGFSSTAS